MATIPATNMIKDGNSIFIFEVAGLCIGHLGHLHVKLDDSHFAAIGRLDILMVPIDGTYTMSLDGVSEITRRLRASVVLPMHRFATPLEDFMQRIGKQFEIDRRGRTHAAHFARDIAWTRRRSLFSTGSDKQNNRQENRE